MAGRLLLEVRLALQVALEPGRAHRARGQARHADELDDVLVPGAGQDALEVRMGVALLAHRERGAELDRAVAHREQLAHALVGVDASRGDQRDPLALDAGVAKRRVHAVDHGLEVEALVGQLLDPGGAQVAARIARVLDDDRIRQPVLAHPLAHHERHAAGVGQDRHERDVRKARRELGQVQRQPGAHHDGVRTRLAGLAHQVRMLVDRLHHVDRDRAPAFRVLLGQADFAVERDQVDPVEGFAVADALALGQQVRMVVPEVHRRDRTERTGARHRGGEPVRGNADPHASLDDRQQLPAVKYERAQPARGELVQGKFTHR